MTEFESIVAELYSGPPGEFVSSRDAHAKQAADGLVAARIRALRKPTTAAWVVNLFARERAPQLAEALRLAAELRAAQADLDAPALARLSRERRALTGRLAADAADLARARGGPITATTLDAVQRTISAAFFDPGAATAVASGRLMSELDAGHGSALDPVTVVAGGLAADPATGTPPDDEVAARRRRRDAERALRDAERARTAAERDHVAAERELRDAAHRCEQLTRRVVELEAELRAARTTAQEARTMLAGAEERRARTAAELAASRDAVAVAERAASTDSNRGPTGSSPAEPLQD